MRSIRNIGIFAHVDAGKTSLTERILARSGAIRHEGSVDKGTAHTDDLDIERRRGISVRSACVSFTWNDIKINLIDTPGHADFAAEIERSMWAPDGAVVLISAAEGVQPQTELICGALDRQHIPYIVFINKCDRAEPDAAIDEARERLSPGIFKLSDTDQSMAALAEEDDEALADYLDGVIYSKDRLIPQISKYVRNGRLHPAVCGSALKNEGIPELLGAICDLLPEPEDLSGKPMCGIVFSLDNSDPVMGRAARVRLFSGSLTNRDVINVPVPEDMNGIRRPPVEHKITQIRSVSADGRSADIGHIEAGDIALVYGLGDVYCGAVLGDESLLPRKILSGHMKEPLITVNVIPSKPEDRVPMRKALNILTAEDPLLACTDAGDEIQIHITGKMQLDVIGDMLMNRWNIDVTFGMPRVIYRETIAQTARGFYAYTMPKPCWAIIEFRIEPLPRGSGVIFESETPVRDIMARYQHQVRQAIPLAIRQGMLGWRVDDVKIVLTGGSHHLIHTHPLDFIVATPVAFLDGLRRGGSVLLEPILSVRVTVPSTAMGRVLSHINSLRGEVLGTVSAGDNVHMTASVPAAGALDLPTEINILTGGRAALSMNISGYRECEMREDAVNPRVGVHPLDTAKYILAARSALEGGIFDE